jgi:hypothetical protein
MAKKKVTGEITVVITNAELVDNFVPALNHLGNLSIKNLDIISKIVKTRRIVKPLLEDFTTTLKQISELECIKDENGNPEVVYAEDTDRSSYKYPSDEITRQTADRIKELTSTKVSFSVTPIKLEALRSVDGVSANVIDSLYEFCDI